MLCNRAIAAVIVEVNFPLFGTCIQDIKPDIMAGTGVFIADVSKPRYEK
jgi:hypothetical protein